MTDDRHGVVRALVGVMLCAAAGCSRTNHRIPDGFPPKPPEMYQPFVGGTGSPEASVSRPPYRLAVGDVIEVIYHVKNVPTPGGYRMKIEDVIRLRFPYQEQFDQEVTVGGDGRIRCLLVGDIRAVGYTASELEEQVKRAYARYIRDPELTVTTEAANVKIVELKKAITTAPRGQSRLVPIKSDGTIDLPYVGEVLVAGKTVKAAKRILDALYIDNDLEEVEVTVQMLNFAPRHIYVMGEVLDPGVVETVAPMTLFQALIVKGGPTVRADRSKVLVIRREHLPVPEAVVVDMDAMLYATRPGPDGRMPDGSLFRYDLYLTDGDILYVPPTALAKATDWIDQVFTKGIRSVLPYSGNVGINFGYDIRSAPVSVKNRTVGPPNIATQLGP
ncbi:MAG: polysaccharide biosynthesis/export family protein [Phycisphaerae bacterium]